jgi:hypothetical protein
LGGRIQRGTLTLKGATRLAFMGKKKFRLMAAYVFVVKGRLRR